MADALICDGCEAIARVDDGDLPAGWYALAVRLDRSRRGYRLHACSAGCAIRALAMREHDEQLPVDERQPCETAGCERPSQPGVTWCTLHAPSASLPIEPRCSARAKPPHVAADDESVSAQRCELDDGHPGEHRANVGQLDEWRWLVEPAVTTTGG